MSFFAVSHPFHSLDTQLTTVDLTLPEEAIPGTGQCKVSAIGLFFIHLLILFSIFAIKIRPGIFVFFQDLFSHNVCNNKILTTIL